MVVHRGERRRHHLRDIAVSHGGDLHVGGHRDASVGKARHGAVGDGIRGADQRIEGHAALHQALASGVAALYREVGDDAGTLFDGETARGAARQEALSSTPARRHILFQDADVRGPVSRGEHPLGERPQGTVFVLVDARAPLELLAEDHQRNRQGRYRRIVRGRKDGRHQDDAIHLAALGEEPQEGDLARGVVIGIGEQRLIADLVQDARDARDHAAHRRGVDLGDDDAHQTRFARAQGLCLPRRHIAGLLDHPRDGSALLLRHVAVVEVPRDRCARNPRHLGDLIDIHGRPPRTSV